VFLRERLTPGRRGVVILGFLGVLRPAESFEHAAFLPLAAAFTFAVELTQTKALTATETWLAILVWMNVIQLPLALLAAIRGPSTAMGTTICTIASPRPFFDEIGRSKLKRRAHHLWEDRLMHDARAGGHSFIGRGERMLCTEYRRRHSTTARGTATPASRPKKRASRPPNRFYSPCRAFLTSVRTDARHRSDRLFV
jgi:hypothetical protein